MNDILRYKVRYLFLAFNFLFWGVSVTTISYLVWLILAHPNSTLLHTGSVTSTYLLMLVSGAIYIIGFVGFCGGTNLNSFLLTAYILLVSIFLVLEIGGVSYVGFRSFDKLDQETWHAVSMEVRYMIQSELQCCGLNGPSDYWNTSIPIHASCFRTDAYMSDRTANHTVIKDGCQGRISSTIGRQGIVWLIPVFLMVTIQIFAAVASFFVRERLKKVESSTSFTIT